jgi:formate hydrogenlyase subunit 3/multisubunit Na+/H+ antiporter MnhD subunit
MPTDCARVLVGFGIATALLGAVIAPVQNHLRRLLAFVTISLAP